MLVDAQPFERKYAAVTDAVLYMWAYCRALHNNNFFGTIPPELGNCTELRAL